MDFLAIVPECFGSLLEDDAVVCINTDTLNLIQVKTCIGQLDSIQKQYLQYNYTKTITLYNLPCGHKHHPIYWDLRKVSV